MTSDYSPSSIDPASYGSLPGTVQFILTKFLQGIDDMLPAMVVSYDRVKNRAAVQPLVSIVSTKNETIQRAQVASVPVLQLGGGGFVLSFPIKPGDLGWIKANDSSISLFKQYLKSSPPDIARLHSFEDAMFIPDTMMRAVVIDPADAEAVTLQSLDGSVRISLHANSVEIHATNLNVTGNITATGDIIASGGAGTPVSLHAHTHSGVTTGGGNTGNPNT